MDIWVANRFFKKNLIQVRYFSTIELRKTSNRHFLDEPISFVCASSQQKQPATWATGAPGPWGIALAPCCCFSELLLCWALSLSLWVPEPKRCVFTLLGISGAVGAMTSVPRSQLSHHITRLVHWAQPELRIKLSSLCTRVREIKTETVLFRLPM